MRNFISKNKTTTFFIFNIILIFLLLALSFPLYKIFSHITGYNNINKLSDNEYVKDSVILDSNQNASIILDRNMKIKFNAEVDSGLNWEFRVQERNAVIKIGENKIVKFEGTNLSNKTITSTADFSVNPEAIFPYLIKIECFCFTAQTLKPGESQIFSLIFYLDSSLDYDSRLDNLKEIEFTYKFSEITS